MIKIRFKTILFIFLVSLLFALIFLQWEHGNKQDELFEMESSIEGMIKGVLYQDEVLSMSARMAAMTGDLSWERRYNSNEKNLNYLFLQLAQIGGDTTPWLKDLKESNKNLVEYEQQAFAEVKKGNLKVAQSFLFSQAYENEKETYSALARRFDQQSLKLAHAYLAHQGSLRFSAHSQFTEAVSIASIIYYILASILLSSFFYFIYQKIPDPQKYNSLKNLSIYRIRFIGLTMLSFLVVFVVTVTVFMAGVTRKNELEQVRASLVTVHKTTEEGLILWVEEKKKFLTQFAENQAFVGLVENLLSKHKKHRNLSKIKEQLQLRQYFREHRSGFGDVGYFIITPELVSIGSMRDHNIGTKNVIAIHRPDLLQHVLAGETVFVPPIHSDVSLDAPVHGKKSQAVATMFLVSPIKNRAGKVIALLSQRLRPEEQFSKMLQLGRIGESGETYAFDKNALLISHSRFDQQVVEQGIIKEGKRGILNLEIRDHSKTSIHPVTNTSFSPLTLMAESALQGQAGSNVEGYNDYRGVKVFGVWAWSQKLGIGITTEIDAKEGLVVFQEVRLTLYSLVGSLLLMTVLGVFFLLYISEKTSKVILKSNEELEERVHERTAELELAIDDAQAAVRAKSDFLANMSHEIRTPMNAILGFLGLSLESSNLPKDIRSHLFTAHHSAKNLLVIINDILDISKMEAGKITLEHVCFNLRRTLVEVIRTLEQSAEKKGIYLSLDYGAELSLCTVGDDHRLRQVMMNLVGNAIKFTEKGGITIKVQWATDEHKDLYLQIEDSGIGISSEQVPLVFDAFTQADSSTARKFGGTGLGTTISKQLIEAMGGKIWVSSEVGVGSIFHIQIPFYSPECGKSCVAFTETVVEKISNSPRQFHVLLAEDIAENATLVELRLKQQNHTMVWVKDGAEAVARVKQEKFDIVLMDVQMPVMDGLEATRQIRQNQGENQPHLPIVALTASVLENDRKHCFNAGMDEIVAKPIDVETLLSVMEQLVPKGQGQTANTLLFTEQNQAMNQNNELNRQGEVQQKIEALADVPKAMAAWGEMDVYLGAISSFIKERRDNAQLMIERIELGDLAAAKVISHTIKGVLGNFQLTKAYELCVKIDNLLAEGQTGTVIPHLHQLEIALEEVYQAVAGKPTLPAEEELKGEVGQLPTLLQELLVALEQDSPDVARPVLDQILPILGHREILAITEAISSFDFEVAKEETKKLMRTYQQPR